MQIKMGLKWKTWQNWAMFSQDAPSFDKAPLKSHGNSTSRWIVIRIASASRQAKWRHFIDTGDILSGKRILENVESVIAF